MSDSGSLHNTVARARHRAAGRAIAIVGAIVIAVATLTPAAQSVATDPWCIICGPVGGVDAALNVLLFAPLGFGLALVGARARVAIPAMVLATVAIEALQFGLIAGRDASLGDIIMNSCGGAAGFALGLRLETILRPGAAWAGRLFVAWAAVWIGIQAAAAFALRPVMPGLPYYGQLARDFGPPSGVFHGRVLAAEAGGRPITDSLLPDGDAIRSALGGPGGGWIVFTAVADSCGDGEAPIVRIAGDNDVDVATVEEIRSDLVFGIRTGAATLRLRPLLFRVPGVFGAACSGRGGATTRVWARYTPSSVRVRWQTAAEGAVVSLTPRQSMGWTLLAPMQWFIQRTTVFVALSGLWNLLLLLPAAYWAGHAPRTDAFRAVTLTALGRCAPVMIIGLAVIPVLFRAPAAAPADWGAAILGIGTGAWLARRARRARQRGAI